MSRQWKEIVGGLVLGAGLAAFACSAPPGSGDDDEPGSGSGGNGGSDYEGPGSPEECDSSVPGERLLRRLTQLELANTLTDVFPVAVSAATTTLPSDLTVDIRLSNDASTLVMGTQMAEAILANAEKIAGVITDPAELPNYLDCAATADAACVETFINQFGERLFRRPLSDDERARYVALYNQVSGESDFNTGLKWTLVALIQSTHTVHRSELGSGDQLTPYEVASQLSYNYSASPPSPELMALALSGELDDPDTRVAEARKLLETDRGMQVVQRFFDEWLSLAAVETVTRASVPDDFGTLQSRMRREASLFLEHLLYNKSGGLEELLTADYTVADAELAGFYGFTGGAGDLLGGTGEEVPRTYGLGVFAQGAVLTTMASIDITSPTRRGLLLLERLFCEVPGVPEAANFDLNAEVLEGNTTRERLQNSHLQPACQSCHDAFDPLGFAFEHFDHAGRYREEEVNSRGTFPVDATTVVAKLNDQEVTGQEELMNALAGSDEMASCVSGTMERYVYGSAGTCRARDSRLRLMNGETSIIDFLAELAAEPHFVARR